MKASELAKKAIEIATKYKTLYVYGCFGAPMTEANKPRYINSQAYNRKAERLQKIKSASADTFGFDCVCLFKGIVWGWSGNKNHVYGGASYQSGMPDITIKSIANGCKNVSSDFSKVKAGEFLWNADFSHCGICVGMVDGKLCKVEASPSWADGVQLFPMNEGNRFAYHGMSAYVEDDIVEAAPATPTISFPVIAVQKGSKGKHVLPVQIILKGLNFYNGNLDSDAGNQTHNAIVQFQKSRGLYVDGVFGIKCWENFLGL